VRDLKTASILRFVVALAWAIALPPNAVSGQAPDVTLTPAIVVAGAPELIRVSAPSLPSVDGDWMGKKLEFFRGRSGNTWFALAGADVEAPIGASTLHISAHAAKREAIDLSRAIEIHPAHYRTTSLTVAPKFVEPGLDDLPRIKAEAELKEKIFSASASEPLWSGSFAAPVHAAPTDSFGTRRVFNGKLDSVHKGMDFRAQIGTIVRAGNSGVVVLARPLYYEGNCVVIDHGLGLYTISMHLSRINVHEEQRVLKGQRIGLSGATGRVTGPHLHWAVRWEGTYLDPAKLLRMNLAAVR
jgi:murein DD-endopeptidase MepM/ murein hydrolase activator NlpD